MTQRQAWYGGNKIPDSYLKKFSLPQPNSHDGLPFDLKVFLDHTTAEPEAKAK